MAKFHIPFVSLSLAANNQKFDWHEFTSAVIDTESKLVAARRAGTRVWVKVEGMKTQKLVVPEYSWGCKILQRE